MRRNFGAAVADCMIIWKNAAKLDTCRLNFTNEGYVQTGHVWLLAYWYDKLDGEEITGNSSIEQDLCLSAGQIRVQTAFYSQNSVFICSAKS